MSTATGPERPRQGGQSPATQPGMQGVSDQPRDKKGRFMPKRRPVDLNKGKGMMIWGTILAIFGGFISFVEFFDTMGMGFIYMLQSIGFPWGCWARAWCCWCAAPSGTRRPSASAST